MCISLYVTCCTAHIREHVCMCKLCMCKDMSTCMCCISTAMRLRAHITYICMALIHVRAHTYIVHVTRYTALCISHVCYGSRTGIVTIYVSWATYMCTCVCTCNAARAHAFMLMCTALILYVDIYTYIHVCVRMYVYVCIHCTDSA